MVVPGRGFSYEIPILNVYDTVDLFFFLFYPFFNPKSIKKS